jgi:hypothetical protein
VLSTLIGGAVLLACLIAWEFEDSGPDAWRRAPNNTIREVGVAMGVAVLASVFASHGFLPGPTELRRRPLVPAAWVGAAIVAVGALVSWLLPRRIVVAD